MGREAATAADFSLDSTRLTGGQSLGLQLPGRRATLLMWRGQASTGATRAFERGSRRVPLRLGGPPTAADAAFLLAVLPDASAQQMIRMRCCRDTRWCVQPALDEDDFGPFVDCSAHCLSERPAANVHGAAQPRCRSDVARQQRVDSSPLCCAGWTSPVHAAASVSVQMHMEDTHMELCVTPSHAFMASM